MKTTEAGKRAEQMVAKKLKEEGFKILDQNWKTAVCEIDIVAKKKNVVYFVEVKFRSSDKQGGGLDYITPRKIKQMRFAAEVWNRTEDWEGDWRLVGVAVAGGQLEFVEIG